MTEEELQELDEIVRADYEISIGTAKRLIAEVRRLSSLHSDLARAIASEREQCARVAEENFFDPYCADCPKCSTSKAIAAFIRARGGGK